MHKNIGIKERRCDQLITIVDRANEQCLTDDCCLEIAACIERAKLDTVRLLAGARDHH